MRRRVWSTLLTAYLHAGKDMQPVLDALNPLNNIPEDIKHTIAFSANQDARFTQALNDRAISSGIFFLQNSQSQLNTLLTEIVF